MQEGKYLKAEGELGRQGLGESIEEESKKPGYWEKHDERVKEKLMPQGDQPKKKVNKKDK